MYKEYKCKVACRLRLLLPYVACCVWVWMLAAIVSCGGRGNGVASGGDTLRMKYAKHITMVRYDGYTVVDMQNPWNPGTLLHRYILVKRADSARVTGHLPEGTVVYTPVRRSVVFTSPHCWLLTQLGAVDAIAGVCDLGYINVPEVRRRTKLGAIADCGNGMSPSVERIIDVRPEALFVSPYEGAGYGKLEQLGVPLIECADYMETSALGRAEWMRFYGCLVGKERVADSLFAVVDKRYCQLRGLGNRQKYKPKVITERVVSGVWYCPGGQSSMGRLIADAGASYAFASDAHSGSLTLSPEKVIEKAADSDVWLFIYSGPEAPTRSGLLAEYQGYKMIKAFNDGGVYGCNSSSSTPYFEEISFRPDFLLEDLIGVFHTNIAAELQKHYYEKLF